MFVHTQNWLLKHNVQNKCACSNSIRKGFPHGIRSLELPIKLKNGPQTVVLLRANVTSPEVELSHEELDFDSVLVGQGKTKYIQVAVGSSRRKRYQTMRMSGSCRCVCVHFSANT